MLTLNNYGIAQMKPVSALEIPTNNLFLTFSSLFSRFFASSLKKYHMLLFCDLTDMLWILPGQYFSLSKDNTANEALN